MMDQPPIVPLYQRVLGRDFDRLPTAVRALHAVRSTSIWIGRADVERGGSIACRIIAVLAGLPPDGADQPLAVKFTPENGTEIWHRAFGQAVFRTRQAEGNNGVILETAGPLRLELARLVLKPTVSADGLSLDLIGLRVMCLPLPRFLVPVIATREYEQDGRYRFEVEARIKGLGRLVRYSGWLAPAPRTDA